jgi:predicted MFS family arabinose efflux permease
VLGLIILVMGVPVTAMFVRERSSSDDRRRHIADGPPVAEGLRSRPFWLLVGILFLSSIAINGAVAHLSPLLTDRGLTTGTAALALSVLGAASLSGRLITGHLLDATLVPG